MSGSHKHVIEEFTKTVNDRHVHHLDKVLEHDVEKRENSKVVYKNIAEAREYYSMEHEAHPSVPYKVVDVQHEDESSKTIKARVLYNNHTYNTTYTFSASGKIQKIDSVLDQQHETK